METRAIGPDVCVGHDATFRHYVASDTVLLSIITAESQNALTLHLTRDGAEQLVMAAVKAMNAAKALKYESEE